jgi:hypothetical protein
MKGFEAQGRNPSKYAEGSIARKPRRPYSVVMHTMLSNRFFAAAMATLVALFAATPALALP